MPKRKIGILGAKAKKQMLFSFNSREGEEWPSDDSSDEDFVLGDETGNVPTKSKKRKSKQPVRENIKRIRETPADRGETYSADYIDRWGQGLPPELLVKIFQYVINKEGALPFLVRASKVNTIWNNTSKEASLWTSLDLSYGWIKSKPATINWLCSNRLNKLKQINLSSWKTFTQAELELLALHCPLLESINVSGCPKMKASCVKLMADSFQQLHSVDVSATSVDAASHKSLSYLLQLRGSQLKSLVISNNRVNGFQALIGQICSTCTNLEVLDISNIDSQNANALLLHIEKFQRGCPKLRVLRMANVYVAAAPTGQEVSDGFRHLEELSLAFNTEKNITSGVNDNFLSRLLKTSHKLQLLDIRGCKSVSGACVFGLPCEEVHDLYMSRTQIGRNDDYVNDILRRWSSSLKTCDLSWNAHMDMDSALQHYGNSTSEKPVMESMDLSGNNVTYSHLKDILTGCPRLHHLALTSCRSLPRGMKRDYSGKSLTQLRKEVK